MKTAGSSKRNVGSWLSQGGKPGSKGFPRKASAEKEAGKVDNMAGKWFCGRGRGEEGKREEMNERRAVFKGKTMGSQVGPTGGISVILGQLLSQAALVVVGLAFKSPNGAYISIWSPP